MRAWLTIRVPDLLATPASDIAARLAAAQAHRHAGLELTQLHSWTAMVVALQSALADDVAASWTLLLEYDLLRLEKRIDAILLTDRAIVVLEWKDRAARCTPADLRQVEDYALDLHDFHAGSRGHPIVPVLVATHAPPMPLTLPLIWHGVTPPMTATLFELGTKLLAIHAAIGAPATPLDNGVWLAAPYRPVPSVLEAAAMLFDRHRSGEMTAARADAANLNLTTDAIRRAIADACAQQRHIVVFVTGIPGAGKTLCGLNVVFGALREHGAAFLTGNVPLVTVLRADLARRQAQRHSGRDARTALQNVHKFLEHHVAHQPDTAPEARIIVFDEAQRAWDEAQATKDSQRRVSHLTRSEPTHTLDVMGRHRGWSVVVALIGNGQEINTGEAGLAEWGKVIAASAAWTARAAPRVLDATEAAQRLVDRPQPPWLELDEDLDLTVPMRSVRHPQGAPWVDAVLAGEATKACAIASAAGGVPFFVTRDLDAMRTGLRLLARGERRAGLVASAGARRLRADGLGVQVPDIATWFLERWPDIRGSDALETFATEYDCQGLELDLVGLAWGGDLIRRAGAWLPRRFHGKAWQSVAKPSERLFIRNTYRVLLTPARYETVIWIPRGSQVNDPWHDPTRLAADHDALADYLLECGAQTLTDLPIVAPTPALL